MARPVYIGTIGVAVGGVDDGTEFMCPECCEVRGQEVALRFCAMHERIFTKGGVYGCPACGKSFIRIPSRIDTLWYPWGSYVKEKKEDCRMFTCENCGTELDYLGGGGCGGRGSAYGCPKCEIFFEQVTGGILGTQVQESFKRVKRVNGGRIVRVAGHYKPAQKPEAGPPDLGPCIG